MIRRISNQEQPCSPKKISNLRVGWSWLELACWLWDIHDTLASHVVTGYEIQRWSDLGVLVFVYQLLLSKESISAEIPSIAATLVPLDFFLPVRSHAVQKNMKIRDRIKCLGISKDSSIQLAVRVQWHNYKNKCCFRFQRK